MILFDLASPAEAGFAKAGNRCPLFGIMHDLNADTMAAMQLILSDVFKDCRVG